ncbi:MAG: DNA repair and recombination protein RadA [Candidatus Geothermarchaeales archaeon]
MAETILDLDLENVEGIGPKVKEKLVKAGMESVLDLAASIPSDVEDILGGTEEKAASLILAAKILLEKSGLLEKAFTPALEIMERRRGIKQCTTGSKNLDALLKGGIETQAITELYGDYGSGKTQICHVLCCTSQLPVDQGGLGGGVIFIDTEATFRPERVYEIAKAKELDTEEILRNVIICKVYNSSHLELVAKTLGRYIERFKAKMVIVDSVISLHRAEFTGRGTLAERQQRLNALIHRLLRIAEIYNVAVVVTNQVQAKPDTFFGDPTRPAGGHVIAHACTYRIYLKKAKNLRTAVMVDSPYHPYGETQFQITERGIEDPESS